jgi:hypothetical protein
MRSRSHQRLGESSLVQRLVADTLLLPLLPVALPVCSSLLLTAVGTVLLLLLPVALPVSSSLLLTAVGTPLLLLLAPAATLCICVLLPVLPLLLITLCTGKQILHPIVARGGVCCRSCATGTNTCHNDSSSTE